MINKIKAQLKKFWKWITFLIIGGVVLAAGIALQPEEIPFIIVNGERIEFVYTDDNEGEDLIIRTNKATYGGWDKADVYVMVENKSGQRQTINLQVFFSNESKSVVDISRLKLNVPYEIDIPDYQTVDYDCSTTVVSSTTEEMITEKKTCQTEEQIGTHKETKYRDEWQTQILEDFSQQENNILIASQAITEKDKKGLKAEKKIQIPVLKDEAAYFKIKIKFPRQTKDEFIVEALGSEGGYGHLDPWYDASFLYKKKITIDEAKVDADLVNFPVLVALASSTNFDFTKARSDGFDVIFTKDDESTLLDFERERYSTTTEQAEFWVKIPSVASSTASTTFYMYYGNAAASDISSSTAVWDANYKAVYHLKDLTTSTIGDSTGVYNATKAAANRPVEITGQIAKGQDFEPGTSDYILSDSTYSTGANEPFTVSGWAKFESQPQYNVLVSHAGAAEDWTLMGGAAAGNTGKWATFTPTGGYKYGSRYSTATWYHFVWTFDGSNGKLYLGGEADATYGTQALGHLAKNQEITIGRWYPVHDGFYFDGILDEVRISNIARSAAWIKADYNSGNDTLLSYGEEEEAPAPAPAAEPQMEVIIIE